MNEFDAKAHEWDLNPMHIERSEAIASHILEMIPLNKNMTALEYGAGSGLLGFLLQQYVNEIVLMDSSQEMVNVMQKKIDSVNEINLKPVYFDLEHYDYSDTVFDLIFSTMVLHHVTDTIKIIGKFYSLLNPGGFLAIADLYKEDGSFHGDGFNGHNGFDVDQLSVVLKFIGFNEIRHKLCYTVTKTIANGKQSEFPVFLMVAKK
jgi:tRNA (cmo5U34)-methyltransferase